MIEPVSTRRAALVTGASRRIGRSIALDLSRHGWSVALHYGSRSEDAEAVRSEIEAAGGRAVAIGADLADPLAADRLMGQSCSALGPITCLLTSPPVRPSAFPLRTG